MAREKCKKIANCEKKYARKANAAKYGKLPVAMWGKIAQIAPPNDNSYGEA